MLGSRLRGQGIGKESKKGEGDGGRETERGRDQ